MKVWTPWHFSSFSMVGAIPEDLQLPEGVDLDKMPRHPELGRTQVAQGNELARSELPLEGHLSKTVVQRQLDTNGDGLADTFVTMSPWNPDEIANVSVGAPVGSASPHTVYFGSDQVHSIQVVAADGSREFFRDGFFEQRDASGNVQQWHDFDGNGTTDHINMGRNVSRVASRGWPYVGYSPKES